MGIRPLLCFHSVLFLLLGAGIAGGADLQQKPDQPVYTNQDIEKYDRPAQSDTPSPDVPRRGEHKTKSSDQKDEKEKERWCKKGAPYHKKISRIKDDIKETETALTDQKEAGTFQSKHGQSLRKKMAKLQRQLHSAEKDLSVLEDEANRKNIPPGWLRCQFE